MLTRFWQLSVKYGVCVCVHVICPCLFGPVTKQCCLPLLQMLNWANVYWLYKQSCRSHFFFLSRLKLRYLNVQSINIVLFLLKADVSTRSSLAKFILFVEEKALSCPGASTCLASKFECFYKDVSLIRNAKFI